MGTLLVSESRREEKLGLCGDEICRVPLDEVVGEHRPLDPNLYKLAGVLSSLPE